MSMRMMMNGVVESSCCHFYLRMRLMTWLYSSHVTVTICHLVTRTFEILCSMARKHYYSEKWNRMIIETLGPNMFSKRDSDHYMIWKSWYMITFCKYLAHSGTT